MGVQYHCKNRRRRDAVEAHHTLNGIDYLEVLDQDAPVGSPPGGSPRQQTLLVYCLKTIPATLTAANARIEGGVRVTPMKVEWAGRAADAAELFDDGLISDAERVFFLDLPEADHVLVVRTDSNGDFSTYRLVLVSSPTDSHPPDTFDPQLAGIDFSFKVECPTEFDCKTELICPPQTLVEPQIDYLAKDFTSFRRLMLDRMSVSMPDWHERNPADVQVALVELLAYVGDHLSYFQDAVATEAYLGTARKRVSVRRHARLLDYRMHEGCNARTWVCFEVAPGGGADGLTVPAGTPLLTRGAEDTTMVDPQSFEQLLTVEKPEVFETMHSVLLHYAHNIIPFYTWTDTECCLPRGSTLATLHNDPPLALKVGDVLIFEEVLSPTTGETEDADPTHRHAVRLTRVVSRQDPLDGTPVLDIAWHEEDALPFPLCISTVIEGRTVTDVSLAHGNTTLVEHGQTSDEELEQVPTQGSYRPQLQGSGITHRVPYDDAVARTQAAAVVMQHDPHAALPIVELRDNSERWLPQRDLLGSNRFSSEFVVEMEDDGHASLRFGDGVFGKQPTSGTRFKATYRVGNGRAGNVGAEAIRRVVLTGDGVTGVRNPLPATGGTEPERMEQVRQFAPQAFRRQERAVTEADYAEVAQRHPEVQKAMATRRWTGSWYTIFITIDRKGGRAIDADFEDELRLHLERFRMAGFDVEIDRPVFVPLDIVMRVCVKPGHFRSEVKQSLLQTFSSQELGGGRRGFFHPDRFTFGQSVYLSQLYQVAMEVDGIAWVEVTQFQRWGRAPNGEIDDGFLAVDRLEVVRLDNDPNFPENGKIDFDMLGGL